MTAKRKRTTGCVRSRTKRAAMMRLYAALKKLSKAVTRKNYYLRGTYTHYNPHFCEDTLDMTKIGKEISVEPVVGTDEPYVLTEEDLPVLYEEYDKLARAYLQKTP